MKYLILITAILFGINSSAEIIGKAKITDGDTIVINDIRIRFTGSDALKAIFLAKLKLAKMTGGKNGSVEKQLLKNLKN